MQDRVLGYAVNSNPVVMLDCIAMVVWQMLIFMEIAVKVCHFDMGEERSGMSECCLKETRFLIKYTINTSYHLLP